jgi:hypothetical protein
MLWSEPAFGPARLRGEPDLDKETERLLAGAGFHNAFQLLGFADNPHNGIAGKSTLGEHFDEPLPDLFEISQYGLPSSTIGSGNKYQLRTKMTADGFRIAHNQISARTRPFP